MNIAVNIHAKNSNHSQKIVLSPPTKSAFKIYNSSDTDNKQSGKTTKTTQHKYATKVDKNAQTKNMCHMQNTSDVVRLSLRNNQTYINN